MLLSEKRWTEQTMEAKSLVYTALVLIYRPRHLNWADSNTVQLPKKRCAHPQFFPQNIYLFVYDTLKVIEVFHPLADESLAPPWRNMDED